MPSKLTKSSPQRLDNAPRRHRSPRARDSATDRPDPAPVAAGRILDAVRDQHGASWVRYGTDTQAIWFAVADLISDGRLVFRRLSSVGATLLTPRSQNALRSQVEAQSSYRPALVASRPGWLEGHYVFGDRSVVSPPSDSREVIVTFDAHPKFTPRGSLAEWQAGVAPFVSGQPLCYFVIGLALSGPLLRFAPRGYLNPQAEIVGEPESGKSSLGVLAASVWAGNVHSENGGGESWNRTLNALDPLKLTHGDGFLFLDEANLASATKQGRREFAQAATFMLAATGSKRRMGDQVLGEHTQLAMLSTTNTPLADLIEDNEDVRNAVRSRRVSIHVERNGRSGVFRDQPQGYAGSQGAVEAMVAVADRYWGSAGRAFVKRLVRRIERDEDRFRRSVARYLNSYIRRDEVSMSSARVQKTFALVAVATRLARRWGILPREWRSPRPLIQAAAHMSRSAETTEAADPLAAVRVYLEQHREGLVEVASLAKPFSQAEFEMSAGFLQNSPPHKELLVPAARFRAAFPKHEELMRALRDLGAARTEGGSTPKLTIKSPKTICRTGRVYCIQVGA